MEISTKKTKTALITGGTSGIGYELAKLFAKDQFNLVIIARNLERLQSVKNELEDQHNIQVKILSKDLTKHESAEEIYDELKQQKWNIDVLVNNAGFGSYGPFDQIDLQHELAMLHVNIVTLTHLTKLFIRDMKSNNSGKILNLSSTAGFMPGPLMAVYFASKSYVLLFSEALDRELKGTGISVSALCPGVVPTNFQKTAQNEHYRLMKGRLMSPEKVAEIGYKGLMKEKTVIIPGIDNKILSFILRFSPRKWVTFVVKKLQEPVSKNRE